MKKRTGRGAPAPYGRKTAGFLIAFFVIIGVLLAWGMFREFRVREAPAPSAPSPVSGGTASAPAIPAPEPPPLPDAKKRLAVIIDDIGLRREPVEKLMALGVPLTFSILPDQPHSRELGALIAGAGFEVMLHLPMEPEELEGHNPGEKALLVTEPDEDILAAITRALSQVPGAHGVNNHMGSLFTRDERKMRVVLEDLKGRGLFFVDSLTTPKSVGYQMAKSMGIKTAERRVFLDDAEDMDSIEKHIHLAAAIAARDGKAVAIGHPHPLTVEALARLKEECEKAGVTPVFISEVLH